MPADVLAMVNDFLFLLKPCHHLNVFVLLICCTIHLLGEVDVKSFSVFCVVVVNCAIVPYGMSIMAEGMKLQQVHIGANIEINKYIHICMEP